MPNVTIENPEHWKALRRQHIGGSEIAALFGVSPWLTKFELFHRKAGNVPEDYDSDKEWIFWGQHLEPAIAKGAAEVQGWRVQKVRRYISHPSIKGLGSTLDYEIIGHERGPGVLEIKTADRFVFKKWEGDLPLNYSLQLQTQLAVTDRDWGAVAVLAGGNHLEVFDAAAHGGAIGRIETAVQEFWESIEANEPPVPDFERDLKTIQTLYRDADAGSVEHFEAELGERLDVLCAKYKNASARYKEADTQRKASKAEILTIIEDAAIAYSDGFKVSASTSAGGKEVKYTTKPKRNFRISERKEGEV